MQATFQCPVCGETSWESAQTYRYARADSTSDALSDYVKRRRRVLFEIWLPGHETVSLQSMYCRGCGFMTYAPRPTEADLDAKYRFLQSLRGPANAAGGGGASAEVLTVNRSRAERVFRTVSRHVSNGGLRVLDYGGGTGQLLAPFIERGHRCSLVDYSSKLIPGAEKIGDTLADLPDNQRFDVIICSHVLEHLAEPGRTVGDLAARLANQGVIYGEVPLEIWKGIPIRNDPATHVSFFTQRSFEELFRRQNLAVLHSRRLVGSYYGTKKEVLVALAGNGGSPKCNASRDGARETQRLLCPPLRTRLRRRWIYRQRFRIRGDRARALSG
jgi:SAM-dependent methyltransferase